MAQAERFGSSLAVVPRMDAAFRLGNVYASQLPESHRARRGVHYTPPALADRLLDLAEECGIDWTKVRVIDPACGGGAFLAPVAARIRAAVLAAGGTESDVLSHVEAQLVGIELDPAAAWMTRAFVQLVTIEESAALRRTCNPNVIVRNALVAEAIEFGAERFGLVVGNPPFGRVRLPSSLRCRYEESLYGHANLYGLFTHLGVQLARPGGLVAYVTPTSFLGGQYFTNLRRVLLRDSPPLAVEFLRDRTGIFEGVLQETALVVFGRGRRKTRPRLSELIAHRGAPRTNTIGSVPLPGNGGDPWLLPRAREQLPMVSAFGRMPHRLPDYGYEVSTGPLVWNRHRRQLRWRADEGCHPLVWSNSVLPTGVFDFESSAPRRPLYIRVEDEQDHLVIRRPCVLVQRTTAKEQSRRLVAAVLPARFVGRHGGVVVENHLNMVRPTNGSTGISMETIAVVLNSSTIDLVYRCISGSVAVSSYELESLPLPPPAVLNEIERCVRSGAGDVRIDALLRAAYGLESK